MFLSNFVFTIECIYLKLKVMSMHFSHQELHFDMCFISVEQFEVSQHDNQVFKETLMARGQYFYDLHVMCSRKHANDQMLEKYGFQLHSFMWFMK